MLSSTPAPDANANWKSLYEAAVHETDRTKLAERITTARTAILDTIEASIRNPAFGEQAAMDAALRTLRKIRESKNL